MSLNKIPKSSIPALPSQWNRFKSFPSFHHNTWKIKKLV